MKAIRFTYSPVARLLKTAITCVVLISHPLLADDGNAKNPTSKFYVADVSGTAEVNTGEKIEKLTKKSVFNAEGAIIETSPDSTNAIVLSNGSGVFLDSDTRLEMKRFQQEPFRPDRTDLETEPSMSQTRSYLAHGSIGICNSKMVAGSSMHYSTPHTDITVRGSKLMISADDKHTTVTMLEGDSTLRGEGFSGGVFLQAGQQAVITRSSLNQPPTIIIRPIPDADMAASSERVALACMARRTVYFDIAERQNEHPDPNAPNLFPIEVTPVNPDDIGPTVSSSSIKGTQAKP